MAVLPMPLTMTVCEEAEQEAPGGRPTLLRVLDFLEMEALPGIASHSSSTWR